MNALNLYTVKVGSVGSFLVAAVDRTQAYAIAEAWQADWPNRAGRITLKRSSDHRVVFGPESVRVAS